MSPAPDAGCILLVRHGQAEARSPSGDAGRRLTDAGRLAFARAARALAGEVAITRILSSPLRRARETADLLAAATGAPVEEVDELASGASTGEELLALGLRHGAGTALVGHNPELAEAVARAGGAEAEVPPGAAAAIGLDGALRWLKSIP